MPEFNLINTNRIYYVTLSLVGGVDVFTNGLYLKIAFDGLKFYQQNKKLEIYAYVAMSNCIHLIVKSKTEPVNIIFGRFKSYTAKEILHVIEEGVYEKRKDWMLLVFRYHAKYKTNYDEFHFWDSDNQLIPLETLEAIHEKIAFIHNIPVEAGLVSQASHWVFSSAHNQSTLIMDAL